MQSGHIAYMSNVKRWRVGSSNANTDLNKLKTGIIRPNVDTQQCDLTQIYMIRSKKNKCIVTVTKVDLGKQKFEHETN